MRCHTTFAFEWSFLGELRGELLGLKCAPWDLGVWSDSHLRSEGVLPRKDTMFSSMGMRCRLLCRSRSCLSTFWHERPCVVLRRSDQGDVIFGAQDIYDTELYATFTIQSCMQSGGSGINHQSQVSGWLHVRVAFL